MTITLHSTGTGPGLVVVHGGGVDHRQYQRLAKGLSDRLTVHLYDRRGRAEAAPMTDDYTVEDDIADLAEVLERTGARHAIGHSGGGFVVLRAALQLDLDRIAVYDGAVVVDGIMPMDFFPDFAAAVEAGNPGRAIAVAGRGLRSAGPASNLPMGVLTAFGRAFLRTPIGRTMGGLLPTTVREDREIIAHAGPASDYAGVKAKALLACGSWSPPYYAPTNEALAAAMPDARTLVVPRSAHDGINVARRGFVEAIAPFFLQRGRSTGG